MKYKLPSDLLSVALLLLTMPLEKKRVFSFITREQETKYSAVFVRRCNYKKRKIRPLF